MSDYQSTAPTTIPLTLTEAKAQLNVSSTADDTILNSYIKAATQMLENSANRCFIKQTRICKMHGFNDRRYVHDRLIYVPRSPLVSVSSIAYINTVNTTTTLASTDYRVLTGDKPGQIGEAYGATWPATLNVRDDVTITYVAGHSTVNTGVPENVKQAVRLVVGHWYRNREAVLTGTISKEIELGVEALLHSEVTELYG